MRVYIIVSIKIQSLLLEGFGGTRFKSNLTTYKSCIVAIHNNQSMTNYYPLIHACTHMLTTNQFLKVSKSGLSVYMSIFSINYNRSIHILCCH